MKCKRESRKGRGGGMMRIKYRKEKESFGRRRG
jgi:hypothetical protein